MTNQFFPYARLAPRLLIIFLLAALIAACGDKDDNSSPSSSKVTAIKIYLEAPQIEYAGIYAAISQGYFEDEQLDVELLFSMTEGSSTNSDIGVEAVLSDIPAFVELTAEDLLFRRQQGEDMVAVLALYLRDSRSIISNVNRGITVPADLVGKRLLVFPGNEAITTVFLHAARVNPEDVIFVLPTPDQGLDALTIQILGGQYDGLVYSTEAAVQLAEVGFPANRMAFIDYGVQSYLNLMVTSRQLIDERPKVVQSFVNAVLRGLQYTLENPDVVAKWFVANYGDQLPPVQLHTQDKALRAIVPLIQTVTSNPGMMTTTTWNNLAGALKELDLLDAAVNPDDAYTMKFLDAYYRQ